MGNKLLAPTQDYREKFRKLLQTSNDEAELKARLLDMSHLRPTEDEILGGLLAEDVRRCIEMNQNQMKVLMNFITSNLLSLSMRKKILDAEETDFVMFIMRLVARIVPIIYEVNN